MIQGFVNSGYEAVIPLTVQGPAGQTQDIEAVIDTGFTGFLTLPSGVVVELGLPFVNTSQATLADGSEVTLTAYRATVLWDEGPRYVRDAADTTPLVGMRLRPAQPRGGRRPRRHPGQRGPRGHMDRGI